MTAGELEVSFIESSPFLLLKLDAAIPLTEIIGVMGIIGRGKGITAAVGLRQPLEAPGV